MVRLIRYVNKINNQNKDNGKQISIILDNNLNLIEDVTPNFQRVDSNMYIIRSDKYPVQKGYYIVNLKILYDDCLKLIFFEFCIDRVTNLSSCYTHTKIDGKDTAIEDIEIFTYILTNLTMTIDTNRVKDINEIFNKLNSQNSDTIKDTIEKIFNIDIFEQLGIQKLINLTTKEVNI